jgi:preprotein translocase subunit SecY
MVEMKSKKIKGKYPLRSKLLWTTGIGIIYFALLRIPIMGAELMIEPPVAIPHKYRPPDLIGTDSFFIFRVLTASKGGSLAEFGIIPIILAILIIQLLIGFKLIRINFSNPEEKALYNTAVKVIAAIITLVLSLTLSFCTSPEVLTAPQRLIIAGQLFFTGIIIILLDELLRRGYGIGNGITLFILVSVSFNIFDGMFNLSLVIYGGFLWFRGCIIAFFQGIARGDLITPFWRPGTISDMFAFFMMLIVFSLAVYFVSVKIEIPAQHRKESIPSRYPIRYLYSFYVPVILTTVFLSLFYFISNLVHFNHPENKFFTWEEIPYTGQLTPTGFFSIFSPPYGPEQLIAHPLQSLGYMLLITLFCGIFSRIWIKTAGMESISVAKSFLDEDMLIPGFREDPKIIARYLNQYIPSLAWLGGFLIGFIAALFDVLSPLGTGTGILVVVCIFREYYELIVKERKKIFSE